MSNISAKHTIRTRKAQYLLRQLGLLLALSASFVAFSASGASASTPADFFGMTTFGQLTSDNEAEEMQRLGVKRVRLNVVWRDFQQSNCNDGVETGISFNTFDQRVRRAAEHGISVIANLYGTRVPGNCPNGADLHEFPMPSTQLYKDYVFQEGGGSQGGFVWQVVQRYGVNGDFWYQNPDLTPHPIKIWEVWNETNFAENNPNNIVWPQGYAKFLIDTSAAIKNAQQQRIGQSPWNVGTRVLFGGLWGDTHTGTGHETAWPLTKYLNAIYNNPEGYTASEAHNSFDGLSYHPYRLRGSAADAIETIGGARTVLNNLGDSNKELWITEIGWPVGFSAITPSHNANEQAEMLNQVLSWTWNNRSYLKAEYAAIFVYQDIPPSCFVAACWAYWSGIRDASGNERPAWCTVSNLISSGSCEFAAPSLLSVPASGVKAGQAKLNARLNPRGLNTKYRFEYGTTTGYGSSSPIPDGSAGNTMGWVDKATTISGLMPDTTYHYRIRAESAGGVSYSENRTFKTLRRSTPSVLEQSNGDKQIFYRGTNGALHFWNWNASQAKWSLEWLGSPGAMAGDPAPIQQPNGNKQIFYRSTDGALHFWSWDAAQGKWTPQWLGTQNALGGDPVPIQQSNGSMQIFYRGPTGVLHFWNWNASLGKWSLEWLGAQNAMVGDPAPIQQSNGSMQIFYRGTTGVLHFWHWNASLGKWSLEWLGAQNAMAGDPAPIQQSDGSWQIFYRGTTGVLHFWHWNASLGKWSLEWLGAESAMGGEPTPTLQPDGGLAIYYPGGVNGFLHWWWWDSTTGSWKLEWLSGSEL